MDARRQRKRTGNKFAEPYTVQGFTLWWLRAKDISVALDDLLADDEFGTASTLTPNITPERFRTPN